MSLLSNIRRANAAAITIALLALGFVLEAGQATSSAQQIPRRPPAEELRWWDERMRRTTLLAFFDGPVEGSCFNVAGILTRQDDRIQLLYPRVVAPQIRHGSSNYPRLLFEDEHCRLQIHFTQEIPDGDRWIALPPQRTPGMVSFSKILTNAEGQELPRIRELHIIPGTRGQGVRMTFGLIESDEGNGLVSQTVLLPDHPQAACPDWTALFTIVPAGAMLVFQNARAALPFSIARHISSEDQSVSFVFSTTTCRLTVKVEKEVFSAGVWTRLYPESE